MRLSRLLAGTALAIPTLAAAQPAADPPPVQLALAAPAAASAAEGSGAADEANAIVVTGSRGAKPRSVADSPVPIDVLSGKELAQTGRTGLKDILGNIVPSLTIPALGGGGTSASVKPISIRGLSGDYVLVLVNGKRRHTTSLINNLSRISGGSTPVDIDLIPTNAVGQIEVLRDGAAAQYGSDAISGVINIILDKTKTGGAFSVTGGQQYSKGAPLVQADASYGFALPNDGFLRVAAEARYRDRAKSSAREVPLIYPLVNGRPDPREATANHLVAGGYGRSTRERTIATSYDGELPVSDTVTLYSFGTYSNRNIRDARGAAFPSPTGFGGQTNRTNGSASLPQVFPDGFQAYRRLRENDFQVAAGARGEIAGWDWDLSTNYGQDHVRLGADNTLNPSIGPTSPTRFYLGTQIQKLWLNTLDVTRDYEIGLARPLTVAVGFEHRWEQFQNRAGEPDSYRNGGYQIPRDATPFGRTYGGVFPSPGLVSFTGTSPADANRLSRNNYAGYVDLSTELTRGWYVGVAGRFEHYDDSAGDTGSFKATTRYQITPRLAVRGGVNSGFRAPSLAQSGFSTTQNTTVTTGNTVTQVTAKFLPVTSAAALALGAQPLKPEKSLNYTAGVTYEAGALHLTVDAYQIRVDRRIVKTEVLGITGNGGPAIAALLAANGVPNVNSGQFFINGVDTRTRGIDAVADYTLRTTDAGTFRLSAAYSYNKTRIRDVADNPAVLAPLGVTLIGRQARGDLVRGLPRDKLVLTSDWTRDRLHLLTRLTQFGDYVETATTAVGDRRFGSKWVTDVELGYDITERLNLAVGANNLFDVYPDRRGVISLDGSGQYGNFAPFGLSGGFWYARLGFRL